jgi:hypothetical protein
MDDGGAPDVSQPRVCLSPPQPCLKLSIEEKDAGDAIAPPPQPTVCLSIKPTPCLSPPAPTKPPSKPKPRICLSEF